jgi:ATP-dependent DNA helicase RecG
MHKLGLVRDIDLALHLPLRYEDETRLTPIARARDGETGAGGGRGARLPRRATRPPPAGGAPGRRQRASLVLRFSTSTRRSKSPGVGQRVRVRGELRGGFFGREMVHPGQGVAGDTRCRRR